MNTQNTITIDNTEYVRKDSIARPDYSDSPVKIVILQRGWVMVGYYERDGDRCTLREAQVIRRWGTTDGLGQLVDGPTSATELERAGLVEFHELTEVATIAADSAAWESVLA